MTSRALPRWAGDYHHIPYKVHGRGRDGIDCWGLVRLVYAEQFGVDLPCFAGQYDDTGIKDGPVISPIVAEEKKNWQEVPYSRRGTGDVIVLRCAGQPMHVGIIITGSNMLHAEAKSGVSIEAYDGIQWKKRIVGIYRHADV